LPAETAGGTTATAVREFARERIRPYVREMDEAGVFRKDIIKDFFEMGLMGIECDLGESARI
jgi:hypothetical protein